MTFDEVSQPYLKAFGYPDQSFHIPLNNNIYKQWYWFKEDILAEFVTPVNNKKTGWEISFAICLDPLKCYRDE